MGNMISAEFYRLRKSKSFWIMIAVAAGLAVFSSVLFGAVPAEDLMGMRPESASEMLNGAMSGNLSNILFILVAFTVIFINGDFSAGTVNNPLAIGITRWNFYIAKFVMLLITCAAFVVAIIIGTVLPYLIFEPWGDAFNFVNFLTGVGLGYLILVAQATLFIAVAILTRNLGATLGIVLGYLVLDMIVGAMILVMEVEGLGRTLANILPTPAGYYLAYLAIGEANFGNVMMVVAVSVVMIIVASLVAVGSLVKKDI